MTFDLSIDLPTETVENLFCEFEDDHAAVPSVASQYQAPWTAQNIKGHDDMLDAFVEYKTPARNIRGYNFNKRMDGYNKCHKMDAERRERYANRNDPRITDDYIQTFIDA